MINNLINDLENFIGTSYTLKNNCGYSLFHLLKKNNFLKDIDFKEIRKFNLSNLNNNEELSNFLDNFFKETVSLNDVKKNEVYLLLTKFDNVYSNHLALLVNDVVYQTENINKKIFYKQLFKDFEKNKIKKIFYIKKD